MRQINIPALDTTVSALGFGCASLGSRVGTRDGLLALEQAHDCGVTWYDVAPSYGDAQAEVILGKFAAKRRDSIRITTKVGIAPAPTPGLMRLAKPILRASVNTFPMLRQALSEARPKAAKMPITAAMVESSVTASLRRLQTDHVDVLFLHGPSPGEVLADEIVQMLERLIAQGKTRMAGIAGSLEAGLSGISTPHIYRVLQLANNPFERNLETARSNIAKTHDLTFITHTVFGAFNALERLRSTLEGSQRARQIAVAAGYEGNADEQAAALLADYAFATNRSGITLVSMLKRKHVEFAMRRIEKQIDLEAVISCLTSIGIA